MRIPFAKLKRRPEKVVPVIVSLTSIQPRLGTLHLVIRSLLVQEFSPKKIVLWLESSIEKQLPSQLQKLSGERFEIRYTGEWSSSHRKLVPSMETYPEDIIVTCDDDFIYPKDWLSLLYAEHQQHPECIIANHTLHINHDANGEPLPFRAWKYPESGEINPRAIYPVGAWGVLYPPHSLFEAYADRDLFMRLTPKSDDHWFKAMSLLKGTTTLQAGRKSGEPIPVIGSQKVALKKENLGQDKNTVQWQTLEAYFHLSDSILGKSPAKDK
jgi:hypothetical protein